jgi:hypothetical protein
MAQIVDVRGSGGELVILGGALTLPTQANAVATVLAGSIRYNSATVVLEMYDGSSWVPVAGSNSGVLSFNGRTGGVTLTSSDIAVALGYMPVGGSSTISYSNLPASLKTLPLVYTSAPLQPPAVQVWTIPVVIGFSLPANCTGSAAVCGVPSTASAAFTLGYKRGSSSTTLGTITYAIGQKTATFSTTAYTAVVGDIVTLTTPAVQDASLAQVGITVLGTRTS